MEEPGVVVEGFGDTDETYLDLQDEPVTLAVEVLILPCIEFRRERPGGAVQIAVQCFAVWIAMQFVHASCLNICFSNFSVQFEEAIEEAPPVGQKVALILVLEEGSPRE